MNQSSAEFPIAQVIEACEEVQDFYHDEAVKAWEGSEKVRQENAQYDGVEEYAVAMATEKGPTKLHALCLYAQLCGETKVRLTADDFWSISGAFRRSRRPQKAD